MTKIRKTPSPLIRIKSKVNSDSYYTSKDFPEKVIDGKVFIGVKKTPTDKTLHYMLKENMEKVPNNP